MSPADNPKLRARRQATPSRHRPDQPMGRAELAEAVVDHLHRTSNHTPGITADYIGRLERGEVRWPGRRYRDALRHVLAVDGDDDLGFTCGSQERASVPLEPAASLAPVDTGHLRHPWTTQGAVAAVAAVSRMEDAVHRRTFIALGGAALTALSREWLIAPPAGAATSVTGVRLVEADVEGLDYINAQLRLLDDRHGGGAILTQAQAQVQHVASMVTTGSYTDRVGRHLLSATAELLRVTGWMAFSANRHGDADRYWTAALQAAHSAGDLDTARNTLGFMSCMAKDTGAGSAAVHIADAALEHRSRSPRLEAVLHMRAAQASAQIGDRWRTATHVEHAENALASAGPASDLPAVDWMDAAYGHAMAGFAFLRLGELHAAEQRLRIGVDAEPAPALRAELLALLGQVHARQGDVAAAVDVAGQAVDLLAGGGVRCPSIVNQLKTVDLALGRRAPEFSARVGQLVA